ncbi:MAG: DNA polymerase III subunit gamma/tau [Candidatus Dormiibacterota bacterium]
MSSENSVRQTLYLKYRPQRFAELVGQEVVATTMRNAVREGRLSHAFLFTGIRGTGKTSAARILARAINCEALEEGEPCGVCAPCVAISQNRSLDVIEIDAATNRGIDEIRDLRERAQFLPSQFRTKVYIIDEAHMLTPEAGNAFLKTLEEPPEHACFILATTEPQRLADTVLSRCQRFDFRRIPVEAMAAHLGTICAKEGVTATPDALALVAEAGAGSLRDALSLLDRLLDLADGELSREVVEAGLGMADPRALVRLAAALARADMAAAWGELHQLQAGGVEPRQLIRSLGNLAKDQLWQELSPGAGTSGPPVEAIAAPPGFWLDLMAAAAAAGSELRRADDPWMSLEAGLLRLGLSSPSSSSSPPESSPESKTSPNPPVHASDPAPDPALEVVAETAEELPSPLAAPVGELDGSGNGAPEPMGSDHAQIDAVEASPRGDGVERWPEILAWLGRDNIPVQALLKSGRPASHQEGVLTLEFDEKFDFHVRQMESSANRAILERACLEVLGQEVEVKVVKSSPASAADQSTGDGGLRSSALSQAMNVFPGSRLTRLGTGEKR